jgi:hypothetical protein
VETIEFFWLWLENQATSLNLEIPNERLSTLMVLGRQP